MPIPALVVGMVAAQVVSGIMQYYQAEKARGANKAELDRIENGVTRIKVPLHFSDQLYDLRGHIDLMRQRLMPRAALRPAA